jgi:hypothetical protein
MEAGGKFREAHKHFQAQVSALVTLTQSRTTFVRESRDSLQQKCTGMLFRGA